MAKKTEEKPSKNPLVVLLKTEWEYLGNKRPMFIFYMFLFFIAGIVSLMEPLVIGYIFNSIQNSITTDAEFRKLTLLIFLLLVIDATFWAFHGTGRVLEKRTGFIVSKNYTNKKIQRVLDLPMSWHKDHHSGDTIDKINKGKGALDQFARHQTYQIVYVVINLIGSALVLAFFDWKIALFAITFSCSVLYILTRIDKIIMKLHKEVNKHENKASASIFDYVSNIITVITLRLKKTVKNEIDHKLGASYKPHKKRTIISESKWGLSSISISLMLVIFLIYKSYVDYNANGVIMIGTLYILYGYLNKIGFTFYSLANLYGEIVKSGANLENAEPIDKEYFKIKNKLSGKLNNNWKSIQLKNIDFTYNEENKASHIDNVSLTINRGEKIAFVGESGSGKSTMLSLLRGLYDPDKGEAYEDNKKLKNGVHHLQHHVTLIPQEPEIFNNTIKFNITMGLPYKKSQIDNMIKLAMFEKVVKRLDKGLNTNVMEKGVSLSGGEKQRLALARGLLAAKNSDIILMDEPTSSVDSLNELKIHDQVFKHYKEKTIISSIHRLHLLHKFDKIYYFEKGKIIASGTLNEMKKIPTFKKLLDKYNNNNKNK